MTPQKTCRREEAKAISPERCATSKRQFQCIEWDALNRLIKVELKGTPNITVTEISYDVLNRRVWREADEDQDGTPDEDLTYVWDGWRNIEERDYSTEDLLRDYVYGGAYIDEVVHGRSDFWDGSTPGPNGDFADSKEQFYYTTNNLYSVAALVDTSGSVIERYEYLPYGAVTTYTGAGVDSTWFTSDDATSSYSDIQHVTFTGRRSDPEAELMYFRNRYYSPELGRFVTRDAADYTDGMNLYAAYFVPRSTDPLGEFQIITYEQDKIGSKKSAQEACECGTLIAEVQVDASQKANDNISGDWNVYRKYVGVAVFFTWSKTSEQRADPCCCKRVGWKQWVRVSYLPGRDGGDLESDTGDPEGWYMNNPSSEYFSIMEDYPGAGGLLGIFAVHNYCKFRFKSQAACLDEERYGEPLATINWEMIIYRPLFRGPVTVTLDLNGQCEQSSDQ